MVTNAFKIVQQILQQMSDYFGKLNIQGWTNSSSNKKPVKEKKKFQ